MCVYWFMYSLFDLWGDSWSFPLIRRARNIKRPNSSELGENRNPTYMQCTLLLAMLANIATKMIDSS